MKMKKGKQVPEAVAEKALSPTRSSAESLLRLELADLRLLVGV